MDERQRRDHAALPRPGAGDPRCGRFLGEALTAGKRIALVPTFLGSALVVQVSQPANLTGNAAGIGFGLIAAATYATYSLLGKKLLARHRMATVLAAYLLLGTLLLLGVKLLVAPAPGPHPGRP